MGTNICCCHALSAGAALGILQLTVCLMMMASAGIVLDRYDDWINYEPNEWLRRPTPSTVIPALNVTGLAVLPTHWSEAFMEFQMAEVVGFCAVWAVSLFIYGLTFRFYMPVMVLPNLFVLIMAFVVSLVAAVAIIWRLVDMNTWFQLDEYDEAFCLYVAISYFIWMVVVCVFAVFTYQFYAYVKTLDQRDAAPDTEQGRY